MSPPGVISAAGIGLSALSRAVTAGDNAAMKRVQTKGGKEAVAARIDDEMLHSSGGRYDMRVIQIENAALEQIAPAVEAAKAKYGAERIAVCVGSCDNGSEFSLAGHKAYFETGAFPQTYDLEMQGADYVASFVSEKYALSGISLAFTTACSSSASALVKAAQFIRAGLADAVIAGGVDIASDTTLLGFGALEAIASGKTNPMSKNRAGITLGDAAAFFVLSREKISEESIVLAGWGESADAHHITSPDPTGDGAARAMRAALAHAGVSAEDIGYVNLHGTGTRLNDAMEAKAVVSVLGSDVLCSSTKSETGHTLGAAGALEAAVCYALLTRGILPVQVWDGEKDEEIELYRIVDKTTHFENNAINYCMSNSFAFGGANVSLIFSRT